MDQNIDFFEEFIYIPFGEKPKILLQAWYKFFTIRHAQSEDSNELFQKLLEDFKGLAEYANSPRRDRSNFLNNNEEHSVQYKEHLENSSEIAASGSNQEKEKPPQDSDIRQLIEKNEVKNVVEQPAEHRIGIEKLLQNFRVIHKSSISLNNTSQISPVHAFAPILSTKEPEYSPSVGYEHPNTTPKTESDKIIKSGVEELVPILSENEVTSEDKRECDVPVCENSPICEDHYEIYYDSNNDDDILSDDDAFEDIEYIEASLPDPEIVSVEEENDVHQEEEEIDLEDISQIQDVILRKKLLSINHLIANIESLNDNPTPHCVLNSSVSFPIFEESDNSLSNNFSPEFETFFDHTEETRSGNTTTHADNSLPEYDSFCFEIELDQERLINVVKNDIFDNSTNDPLLEEANLFLASDNSIPPGIENFAYDSEGDIHFLEELLIDDSIPFPNNESSESDFDNLSFPRPPPEPPDAEFDVETDVGKEISVVMNDSDKLERLDPRYEIDVSTNDENDDYSSFMFVIYSKVFSFYSSLRVRILFLTLIFGYAYSPTITTYSIIISITTNTISPTPIITPILSIPLPAASPPLQLLSSDCRADRPEVTLPPRKRLNIFHCLGYEAGESSVAAAARPIEGRRAAYGLVDSVEAEIRRRRA
nr:hypothetical protein [Tanacetum cinerariifolium]